MERMENDCRHPGTILKIKAQDFVSYSKLSFRPSNLVNILLAPNGAGKSSLLSAIVLGLGGKPSIIGKSNQIADFIMYGKEEAKICIDLHDPEDSNEVLSVGRIIKKSGTSVWYLNKRKVSNKEVDKAMARLNIQVDSLCQVLPQERVQDFAKMNSLQLLENVQRVIAGDLLTNYNMLLEYRKSLSSLKEIVEKNTILQKDEIAKYERLEKDVEAIKEKQRVLKTVTFCRQKLAWMLYNDKKEEQEKVMGYLSEAKKKIENFDKELAPLKNVIHKLEKKCATLAESVKNKKSKVNVDKDKLKRTINMIKMSSDQVEHIKEIRNRRLLEANTLQSRIEEAEAKMNELSRILVKENGQELSLKVNKYDQNIKEKMMEIQSVAEQENQMKQEQVAITNAVRILESKLERANSVGKKRLNMLISQNQDVYKGYMWLNENRQKFQSNIYGPILMELNISITEGAKYVEFIIAFRDLISFVTEKSEDMTNLLRTLRDQDKLAVNCAHCNPPNEDISQLYPPLVPSETIRQMGFDCYLIDLIEGPPTVLAHLCNLFRIHLIPVAFNPNNVHKDRVAQFHDIKMYFIGDDFFRVSQSKYSNHRSTSVLKIRPARFLGDSIDKELIRHIQVEVNAKREMLGEIEGELTGIVESKSTLQTELNELRNHKKCCAQRLEQFKSTTVRLRRHEEERMKLLNSIAEGQREETESDNKIKNILAASKPRLAEVLNWAKAYSEDSVACKLSEYDLESAKVLRERKKDELSLHEDGKQKLESDCEELRKGLAEVKAEARNLLAKAKDATDGLEMGDARFTKIFDKAFKNLPNDLDKIKDKINSFEAKARCLDNPLQEQQLKDYEAAKALAESLSVDLAKLNEDLSTTRQKFETVYSVWLPQIDDLINQLNLKFSDFFRKISCVGEVRLNKGELSEEAVENFGLEIRVRFRNDTELQVLDQYVQSGGERALTTAVFLLSLQRLSSLPFRCVDEINQGMDQFNERRVYNLLFNTITDSSSQYFLLTPKFLNNVTYPTICTIFNVYNCAMYKMPEPESRKSQHSQVFADLDGNRMQSSGTLLKVFKDEDEKENNPRAKRRRNY